jgi:hypothetical protein
MLFQDQKFDICQVINYFKTKVYQYTNAFGFISKQILAQIVGRYFPVLLLFLERRTCNLL